MTSELEYSWAGPPEQGEIESFVARAFGPVSWQANTSRQHWLYFENPHGIHIALARHQGRLVAVCPHVVQEVRVAGQMVTAGFGIDFHVLVPWRRQGIGRHFLAMRRQRFALSLSTGQSPAMQALYQSLGAIDIGPFQIGYFRQRPPLMAPPREMLRGWLAWAGGMHASHRSSSALRAYDRPSGDRTAWHQWRFDPTGPYGEKEFALQPQDGPVQGWAVCRQEASVENIIDVRVAQGSRSDLLRAVAGSSAASEVQIQFCGTALAADCQKAGFLLRPRANHLVAMTDQRDLAANLSPGCIDLTAGSSDTDLLRPLPD